MPRALVQRYSCESVSHAPTNWPCLTPRGLCERTVAAFLACAGLRSSRRCLPVTTVAMSRFRQRTSDKKSRSVSPMKPLYMNGSAGSKANVAVATSVAGALLDYSLAILLVFGGCCSYVSTSLASPSLASYYKFPLLLTATSGLMRNCSARIPAPVCIGVVVNNQFSLLSRTQILLRPQDPRSPFRRCYLSLHSSYPLS